MSEQLWVTAILTPAEGKFDQVKELLTKLAKEVEANEPGVLKYEFFQQINGANGTNVFIVHELYKNQAALDSHRQAPHYKATMETAVKESLMAAPTNVMLGKPFAGFESR